MFDKYKNYKDIKMPEDIKNSILESMQEYKPAAKFKYAVKRRILMYAAMFVCLAMVVSAATIIINNSRTQYYVPFVGFTDKDLEIYAIPEIIEFGSNQVVLETVMRVKDPETGKNKLTAIMTVITRDNTLHNNFTELTITTPDGEEYILTTNESGWSQRGSVYERTFRFLYEDFPEINEFTITGADISHEIMLVENAFEELYGYTENDGVEIIMRHVTRNSKVIAFEIIDKSIDLDYFFGEGQQFVKSLSFNDLKIYDETGKQISMGGRSESGRGSDNLIILDERPKNKISRVTIDGFSVSAHWTPNVTFDGEDYIRDEYQRHVYADADIPVPADGGKIEFEEPLVIYNQNGLTDVIYSVERNGNRLTITTPVRRRDRGIIHFSNPNPGENNGGSGGGAVGEECPRCAEGCDNCEHGWIWLYSYNEFGISDEDIENQSVRLILSHLLFMIEGEWEIYFGN